MATKRVITVKVMPPDEERDEIEDEPRPVHLQRGWRDWLLRDYLRYWYLVGCLVGDVFIVLEVWRNVDVALSTSVPLIVLTVLALGEFLLYLSMWGKNGAWGKR